MANRFQSTPSQSRSAASRSCAHDEGGDLMFRDTSYDDVDLLLKGGAAAVQEAVLHPPGVSSPRSSVRPELVLVDASRGCVDEDLHEDILGAVFLHVYDLSADFQKANDILSFSLDTVALGGAFHVGVEVFGSEWSYGCCGVTGALPRAAGGHVYNSSVYLGCTDLDELEFAELMHEMCSDWRGADYQLFSHNCCSFASKLCDRLGTHPVPKWCTRFPRFLSAGTSAIKKTRSAGHQAMDRVRQARCKISAMVQSSGTPSPARSPRRSRSPRPEPAVKFMLSVPRDFQHKNQEVELESLPRIGSSLTLPRSRLSSVEFLPSQQSQGMNSNAYRFVTPQGHSVSYWQAPKRVRYVRTQATHVVDMRHVRLSSCPPNLQK